MSASILLAVSIVWRTSSTRSSNAASWKYELATFAATCSAVLALASDDERSEEHTSELQSRSDLVCRLLLEKKKKKLLCATKLQLYELITNYRSAPMRLRLGTQSFIRGLRAEFFGLGRLRSPRAVSTA